MSSLINGTQWGSWGQVARYAYLTGNVSRSGNTVTLSGLQLQFTLGGTGYAYGITEAVSIRNGGASGTIIGTTNVVWNFNGSTSNTVALGNVSFGVSVNETSHTLTLWAPENDAATFTVSFPSGVTNPTTPTISGVQNDRQSNKITFGTTSFGNPSTGTVYLYGGTSDNPVTQVSAKTTTGNSTFTHSGLESNTTYYYRARAYNGYAWSNYSNTIQITTKPAVYVSESGLSRATQKLYVSLNGQSKTVLKLYDSNNGVARRIY